MAPLKEYTSGRTPLERILSSVESASFHLQAVSNSSRQTFAAITPKLNLEERARGEIVWCESAGLK